ncbi:MAG: phosphatase PAP2 family protein [Smithella sp.]|jgi:undecaprenyl-diphosphatase
MIENIRRALFNADIAVFRFINMDLHNDIAAAIMRFTANDIFLAAVIFTGMFFLVKKGGKKEKNNIAFSLWALIAASITSTFLLKPLFKRPKPAVSLPDVNFLATMIKKWGWAFPSTHTAMAAALVAVLWDDYKGLRWLMVLFVCFIGFFCVYTGGHYPSDVVAGLILGIIIGSIFKFIKEKFVERGG